MGEPAIDLVIYHGGGCRDGFCCAWLLSRAFPEAEFVAARHGEPPPDVTGRRVLIADFSYKREVLLGMAALAESVVVLDHHKTAAEDLRPDSPGGTDIGDRITAVFDLNKSGARLVWEWLYRARLLPPGWLGVYSLREPPPLVAYTEDRDLWRWALPESREINAAVRSHPLDVPTWDALNTLLRGGKSREALVREGRAVLRAEKQTVAEHVRSAREVTLAGHRVLAVNATVLFSEIAGELAKGRPFGVAFFLRPDGKWQYSLRSTEEGVDVSEVAKRYGGGGHPRAAGFESPDLLPGLLRDPDGA